MSEENKKNQNENQPRRFNRVQYDLLKKCFDRKDLTEWNNYRENDRSIDIELEGCKFNEWYLAEVDLNGGRFDKDEKLVRQGEIYLGGSEFYRANMQGAKLRNAHLEKSFFYYTKLQKAVFQGAYVDNFTEFWRCDVDGQTNFRGVPIDTAIIDPMTKSLLKYNIRRMGWEEWYKEHKRLEVLVKLFWQISDYGMSTKRIIKCFFVLAISFAIIYYVLGFVDYYFCGDKDCPGIVSNLFVLEAEKTAIPWFHVPFRAIYFSIVTMTTLGFGDMYANAKSYLGATWGHLLLVAQVLLGYVLLGALITRLAVLFTGEAPAVEFADRTK